MPLIPNDDPAAFAELLGYLGEIGYGELYLRRPEGGAASQTVFPFRPFTYSVGVIPNCLWKSRAKFDCNVYPTIFATS